MKHSFKHLLLTMQVALVSISASAYDFEVDGIYYEIEWLPSLTCRVVSGDTKYTGDVKIPSTVTYQGETFQVVSISTEDFRNNQDLTSIVIGDNVRNLYSFKGCTNLVSVVIGKSVTSIDKEVFYNCISLASIDVPNSVTSIGDKAFYGCESLTSIEIPNSVTSLGKEVFFGCKSLTSIVIPNGVTSIGDKAFSGCESLASIEISDSVTSIGEEMFSECKDLVSVAIPNGVTSIGDKAFSGCRSLTSVDIPNSVMNIGHNAFNECASLASIVLPNSVTSLGAEAFCECTNLTSIVIPNNVTNIDYSTFYKCKSLTSVDIPNSVTRIGWNAFLGCEKLEAIKIPDSVTEIGFLALGNTGVKEVVIGKGIKELPFYYHESYYSSYEFTTLFFQNITYSNHATVDSLQKLVMVDSNEPLAVPTDIKKLRHGILDISLIPNLKELYIGRDLKKSNTTQSTLFIANDNIKRIEFGDSVAKIIDFSRCENVEQIVLGKSLYNISPSSLSVKNLKEIYVKASTPQGLDDRFEDETYKNVTLYVPKGSLDAYQTCYAWKDFWNIVEYDYSTGISNVTIDDSDKPAAIYDLQGRKLRTPQKGLNIINGKKVFVK